MISFQLWIILFVVCFFLFQEVEEFVNGSGEHGIVVFSLGSLVSSMPKEKAEIFFKAFSMIPQRVRKHLSWHLINYIHKGKRVLAVNLSTS